MSIEQKVTEAMTEYFGISDRLQGLIPFVVNRTGLEFGVVKKIILKFTIFNRPQTDTNT